MHAANTEPVEQHEHGARLIGGGDHREISIAAGAGRFIATAEPVDAEHAVVLGVECPAGAALLLPPAAAIGCAGAAMRGNATEGDDQRCVGGADTLPGETRIGQDRTGVEPERPWQLEHTVLPCDGRKRLGGLGEVLIEGKFALRLRAHGCLAVHVHSKRDERSSTIASSFGQPRPRFAASRRNWHLPLARWLPRRRRACLSAGLDECGAIVSVWMAGCQDV